MSENGNSLGMDKGFEIEWVGMTKPERPGNETQVPITGNSKAVFPQTSTPLKIETEQLHINRPDELKPVISVTHEIYRKKKTILLNN